MKTSIKRITQLTEIYRNKKCFWNIDIYYGWIINNKAVCYCFHLWLSNVMIVFIQLFISVLSSLFAWQKLHILFSSYANWSIEKMKQLKLTTNTSQARHSIGLHYKTWKTMSSVPSPKQRPEEYGHLWQQRNLSNHRLDIIT